MINLKFLVVVTSFLVASTDEVGLTRSQFGPKLLEVVDPLHSTCVAKTGVDEALIDKVINGYIVNEPTIKFYMKCIATEAKVLNENGTLNNDIAAELLPEEIKDEGLTNIKLCQEKAKDIGALEEKIYSMFKCYYDLNPDIFIFF